jgi:hypothetical protein
MRKSERLRLLEMELLRTQFQMEYALIAIEMLLNQNQVTVPDMDAGKWYKKKVE